MDFFLCDRRYEDEVPYKSGILWGWGRPNSSCGETRYPVHSVFPLMSTINENFSFYEFPSPFKFVDYSHDTAGAH